MSTLGCDAEGQDTGALHDTAAWSGSSLRITSGSAMQVPDYWMWPQDCELDGSITVDDEEYDVDFQDYKNTDDGVTGEFDGPGSFNGSYSASKDDKGNQSLSLDASGEGHSVDITITIDAKGKATAKGEVDDNKIDASVTISGTGSSKDPFSVTIGDVTLRWMNRCGSID